jgi:hypothetical protein
MPAPSVGTSDAASASLAHADSPADEVSRLLAEADDHLGASVRVTAEICDVAEGGPVLFLADEAGDCRLIVLMDTSLAGGEYTLDWVENAPVTIAGTFQELNAENVDRLGDETLDGPDFVAFWEREGYRYLVVATRIVQGSMEWPSPA